MRPMTPTPHKPTLPSAGSRRCRWARACRSRAARGRRRRRRRSARRRCPGGRATTVPRRTGNARRQPHVARCRRGRRRSPPRRRGSGAAWPPRPGRSGRGASRCVRAPRVRAEVDGGCPARPCRGGPRRRHVGQRDDRRRRAPSASAARAGQRGLARTDRAVDGSQRGPIARRARAREQRQRRPTAAAGRHRAPCAPRVAGARSQQAVAGATRRRSRPSSREPAVAVQDVEELLLVGVHVDRRRAARRARASRAADAASRDAGGVATSAAAASMPRAHVVEWRGHPAAMLPHAAGRNPHARCEYRAVWVPRRPRRSLP